MGSGLYSAVYMTNADGEPSIGICLLFLGESQPVTLFFDNFLAVYNINAFLQSVEGMGLGYVALDLHALQSIDVCGLCLLSDPCGMDGGLEIVLTESHVDDLSTESEVERAVELGVGYFSGDVNGKSIRKQE